MSAPRWQYGGPNDVYQEQRQDYNFGFNKRFNFDGAFRPIAAALRDVAYDGVVSVDQAPIKGSRRSNPATYTGLLDHIHVDYYGSMVPLSQVAQVGLGDARTITVQPWEKKMIPAVEKAIRASNLGLNPQTEGQVIRLRMPELTQDRRKELVKVAHTYAEKARIAVRKPAPMISRNAMRIAVAPNNPNSSPMAAKMKSFLASGIRVGSPRPNPVPPYNLEVPGVA